MGARDNTKVSLSVLLVPPAVLLQNSTKNAFERGRLASLLIKMLS